MTRVLVLGGLGFVGWQWAAKQPAGSSAQKTLGQVRDAVKQATAAVQPSTAHAAAAARVPRDASSSPAASASAGTAPAPVATPPADGVNLVQQYNEQRGDTWYQISQWDDGSFTEDYIDPSQYAAAGITPGPVQGPPDPVQGPPAPTWGPIVQQHADGAWWLDYGFSDGNTSSTYIDPSQYTMVGIMPDGSALDPFPRIAGAPINVVVDAVTGLITAATPSQSSGGGDPGRVEGAPINAVVDSILRMLGH